MVMAAKGTTVNVDVPPEAMAQLKAFCRKKGRIQRDVLAQVIRWFVGQPGPMKRVMLEDMDEEMRNAYAAALRRLADELEAKGAAEFIHTGDPKRQTSLPAPPKGPAARKAKDAAGSQ